MEYPISFPKLNLEFTVKQTAFTIGGFSVQWYGVIIGIGFLLALIYAFSSVKKMNIDDDKLVDAVIGGILGGIIGARLYYVIFYDGQFFTEDTLMQNIVKLFSIHKGGLGFYGGLIGALIVGGLVAKWRKMNIPALFDLVALGFLIGQGVGRWGNFVNQEAFGVETSLPWGMESIKTGGVPVHPCFLYESIACLLGFVLLHIFTRKYRRYDGQTFLLYIVWYGLIRFFVEQLRTDSLILPGGLRISVVVAALCVIGGMAALIVFRKRTSLTGCGNKTIMEENNVVFGSVAKERDEEKRRAKEEAESHSIIFDDEGENEDNSEDAIKLSDDEKSDKDTDKAAKAEDEKEKKAKTKKPDASEETAEED